MLSEDALQPLLESLGGPAAGMFSIPRLERKITAPAIQVVPIAVYV